MNQKTIKKNIAYTIMFVSVIKIARAHYLCYTTGCADLQQSENSTVCRKPFTLNTHNIIIDIELNT